MREKILELEQVSRLLERDSSDRRQWVGEAAEYADRFLEALPELPVYQAPSVDTKPFDAHLQEEPTALSELLGVLAEEIDSPGINPASGGHLGYIPGGGVFPSSIGDFLADVTNRYSGVRFASPGAAGLEQALVDWMADLVGYPETAGGDLTSGGSLANLSAVSAAREAMGIRSRDVEQSCVYLTRQAHHCIDKALRVAGLGEVHMRYVPMDALHRMNVTELEGMIEADREQGLKPFLVVGSAGTTDTGAVDPLVEISQVTRRQELWFHLDAAYGGFFALCDEGRRVLRGMELSDSLVMDPHKGLFLPYGSGAVLVREAHRLAEPHRYHADYMQDAHRREEPYSPAELSIELSRPFRGLRLWMPLRLLGLEPFRAALAEKIWLARYFQERMSELPNWEVGPVPDLSVVTYRYVPERGEADAINQAILEAVHADGRVFITSTLLEGRYTLRLAVLNFRTHLEQVDYLIDLLQETADRLDHD